MKKILLLLLFLGICLSQAPRASALRVAVGAQTLRVSDSARIIDGSTYVPLRAAMAELHGEAQVTWERGRAVVRSDALELTAVPGERYLVANGRYLYAAGGIFLENGVLYVPLRQLAKALGMTASWNAGVASLTPGTGAIEPAETYYREDALYWLSRIISAESRGEPLLGQIAVGNVVMNRLASSDFPNTIYGVIFDDRWGGQFEPVRNGTVYQEPAAISVIAAKLVLDGADAVGHCLYFLAPHLTDNHWTMENREYVTTIGNHWFYA